MFSAKRFGWFSAAVFFITLAVAGDVKAESDGAAVGKITVTGTREEQPKSEATATVDTLSGKEIEEVRPAHPSDIMNRIPGVNVNVTGGEGHQTAIRQPITTSPVYLFLEDGIPTRSTGFFNHNALYEVNIPQSGGIEVNKGPGTALYGSDAIGGVINVLTRPTPLEPELNLDLEGGSFGWQRALLSVGDKFGDNGVRLDLNMTHTDGWRDATDYDRQSANVRWDAFFSNGIAMKTVVAYSNIDQQTAGSSRISKEDYENNPTLNYTPISWRKVGALRVSAEMTKESADSLVSVTPYVRQNSLGYIANWSLSYDPAILNSNNDSYGVMAKYRKDFAPLRTRLIMGVDVDNSPGNQNEQAISPVKEGNIYTSYTDGDTIYDYDVTFMGISPYVHAELSPAEKLRITGGVRYDSIGYDYTNKLTDLDTGKYRRPASTTVDYTHLSPKLGATYQFSDSFNGFVSYNHAFRAPSQSQLFRQGQAENTVGLKPVKVDSYEVGLRGEVGEKTDWELSVYSMIKTDDIVSYTNDDNTRESLNAGETKHQGVELGSGIALTDWMNLGVSLSYSEHTFGTWQPKPGVDYSGNEMNSAPKLVGNTRLGFRPGFMNGGMAEIEWVKVGDSWMDDGNTMKYEGHALLNLRANMPVGKMKVFGRVMNVTDERWATAASYSSSKFGEKIEYAPGTPLSYYLGINYDFM
ncbi:MAG: TonB-dependent receptor [Nitrospinota bacterium]|nr:TonB-dependent receptor [Nitrospinota bacterium]